MKHSKKTQALIPANAAREHCKQTGHHVAVERTIMYVVKPKYPAV